jgi:hypothetical protein
MQLLYRPVGRLGYDRVGIVAKCLSGRKQGRIGGVAYRRQYIPDEAASSYPFDR